MALELFDDMIVQIGGKKGRRTKARKGRKGKKGTKGKKRRTRRTRTRGKNRRGGTLLDLLVPAGLLGANMYMQKRKRDRSRKHKSHKK
jgi:hypothetical protein